MILFLSLSAGGCCGAQSKKTIIGGWGWAWCMVTDVQTWVSYLCRVGFSDFYACVHLLYILCTGLTQAQHSFFFTWTRTCSIWHRIGVCLFTGSPLRSWPWTLSVRTWRPRRAFHWPWPAWLSARSSWSRSCWDALVSSSWGNPWSTSSVSSFRLSKVISEPSWVSRLGNHFFFLLIDQWLIPDWIITSSDQEWKIHPQVYSRMFRTCTLWPCWTLLVTFPWILIHQSLCIM